MIFLVLFIFLQKYIIVLSVRINEVMMKLTPNSKSPRANVSREQIPYITMIENKQVTSLITSFSFVGVSKVCAF